MEPDLFLSGIIGKPSFRVDDVENLEGSMFHGGEKSFAYAKVPTLKITAVSRLEHFGFRVVDTSVQLECRKGDWCPREDPVAGYEVRFAKDEDREAVEDIAGESFIYSRFHLDPEISDSIANQFKRRWAGNFFTGERGDAMVVSSDRSGVTGFVQLLDRGDALVIDLIAIAKSHQRKGLAAAMIDFAWLQFRQVDKLRVGTQVANVPSVRAYQKLGFLLTESSYVLHYHGPVAPISTE